MGSCHKCLKEIADRAILAGEQRYHAHCFVCFHCGKEFPDGTYALRNGEPMCVVDCRPSQKCCACGEGLRVDTIKALDRLWHRHCFVCTDCKQPFHGDVFVVRDNMPYCKDGCGNQPNPTANAGQCEFCSKAFEGGAFVERDGRRMCPVDCRPDKKCPKCTIGVSGKITTAMGHDWHSDCFRCVYCEAEFPGGKFVNENGNPRCPGPCKDGTTPQGAVIDPNNATDEERCAHCKTPFIDMKYVLRDGDRCCVKDCRPDKKCNVCGEGLFGDVVNTMERNFHADCFRCCLCGKRFPDGKYIACDGRPKCPTPCVSIKDCPTCKILTEEIRMLKLRENEMQAIIDEQNKKIDDLSNRFK
eukprot:GFYU01005167.1.p1 GENE.GFYU01005167.1~~GFYU01005167.1.p1  ORF type:complete len:357 (-),score=58.65 GFYU01005167.1:243-1313(-)